MTKFYQKFILSIFSFLGIVLVSSAFPFYNFSLAYTPTASDEVISMKIISKIENIQKNNPLAFARILKVLPLFKIQTQQAGEERMLYIVGELIDYFLGDTTGDDIYEDVFQQGWSSDQIICKQTLGDLTQKLEKKTFFVSSESEIKEALNYSKNTKKFVEIIIKKGTYNLNNGFWIDGGNVIIRGETGNPSDVVLLGKGMKGGVSHIFRVVSSDVYLGDMTIGEVANHPIQIHGEKNADNFIVHNVIIKNAGEQILKGSYDKKRPDQFTDNAIVQCSKFYYSAGIGPQYYIGGIDVHHGKHWLVQYNTFESIRSPETRRAEHAIHFWSNSNDVVVRGNTIKDCDRGVGFGLGDSGFSSGKILNNIITHNSSKGDVGISLENANNVLIQGNTIQFENSYPNAIEYRFNGTYNVNIKGNTTNKKIISRDGGQAVVE